MLQELDCSNCNKLSDISALSNAAIETLTEIDLGDSDAITDISPLKGYTSLEYLNIEKIEITPENRNGYRDAISSLTGLTTLYMPYCYITDEDTEMFSTLVNLDTLVLHMSDLTSTAFCDTLPADMRVLSLHGNDITDMDNLTRFTNLEILGLGDNCVTDFSFISKLTNLTASYVRHVEGTEDFPVVETYYYGDRAEPIELENSQSEIVIDNPYIGVDGNPVSFAGAAVISSDDEDITVSYDAAANQITISNIPVSTLTNPITVEMGYDLPVSGGEVKVGKLRIQAYVKRAAGYTINYSWGTDVPEGQVLPSDSTEYQTQDAAKAAIDKTFTEQTTVKGEKDGKTGTWTFSGWTVTVNGNVVNASGSWSFAEDHQHVWGQPVYTWSQDGTTCTATRSCVEDGSHVEEETVNVTGEVTTLPTCTAKGKTTYIAAFTSSWAETQTRVLEDVDLLPHSYAGGWKSDSTGHWQECAECGSKLNEAAHTFAWVTDKEATATEAGSGHEECTVCRYAKATAEIPATGTPSDTDTSTSGEETGDKNVPQTGEDSKIVLWIAVMLAAGAALTGTVLYSCKKKYSR